MDMNTPNPLDKIFVCRDIAKELSQIIVPWYGSDYNDMQSDSMLDLIRPFIDTCNSNGGALLEFANMSLNFYKYRQTENITLGDVLSSLYVVSHFNDAYTVLLGFLETFNQTMRAITSSRPESEYPEYTRLADIRLFYEDYKDDFRTSIFIEICNMIGRKALTSLSWTVNDLINIMLLLTSCHYNLFHKTENDARRTDERLEKNHELEDLDITSRNHLLHSNSIYSTERIENFFGLKTLYLADDTTMHINKINLNRLRSNHILIHGLDRYYYRRNYEGNTLVVVGFNSVNSELDVSDEQAVKTFRERISSIPLFPNKLLSKFLLTVSCCHLRKRGLRKKQLYDVFSECMKNHDLTSALFLVKLLARLSDEMTTLDFSITYENLKKEIAVVPKELIVENILIGDYEIDGTNPSDIIDRVKNSEEQLFLRSLFPLSGSYTGYKNDYDDKTMHEAYDIIDRITQSEHDGFWNGLSDSVGEHSYYFDFINMGREFSYSYTSSTILRFLDTVVGDADRENRFTRLASSRNLIRVLLTYNHFGEGIGDRFRMRASKSKYSSIFNSYLPISWANSDGTCHEVKEANYISLQTGRFREKAIPKEFNAYVMDGVIPEYLTSGKKWKWNLIDDFGDKSNRLELPSALKKRFGQDSVSVPLRSHREVQGSEGDTMMFALKPYDNPDTNTTWKKFINHLSE
jgi:hypothetical protein